MQRILRILQYEKASKFENIQANLVEFRGEKVLFLCNNCYNSVLLQYNTIEQKNGSTGIRNRKFHKCRFDVVSKDPNSLLGGHHRHNWSTITCIIRVELIIPNYAY